MAKVNEVYTAIKIERDRARSNLQALTDEQTVCKKTLNEHKIALNKAVVALASATGTIDGQSKEFVFYVDKLKTLSNSHAFDLERELEQLNKIERDAPAQIAKIVSKIDKLKTTHDECTLNVELFKPTLVKQEQLARDVKKIERMLPSNVETLEKMGRKKEWSLENAGFWLKFISQDYKEWADLTRLLHTHEIPSITQAISNVQTMKSDIDKINQDYTTRQQSLKNSMFEMTTATTELNTLKRNLATVVHDKQQVHARIFTSLVEFLTGDVPKHPNKYAQYPQTDEIIEHAAKRDYFTNLSNILSTQVNAAEKLYEQLDEPIHKLQKNRYSSKSISFDDDSLRPARKYMESERIRIENQSKLLKKQRVLLKTYAPGKYYNSARFSSQNNAVPQNNFYASSNSTSGFGFSDFLLYHYLFNSINSNEVHATQALLHNTNAPSITDMQKELGSIPDVNMDIFQKIPELPNIQVDDLGLGLDISSSTSSFDFSDLSSTIDDISTSVTQVENSSHSSSNTSSCSSNTSSCRSSCSSSPSSSCSSSSGSSCSSSSGSSCGSSCGGS